MCVCVRDEFSEVIKHVVIKEPIFDYRSLYQSAWLVSFALAPGLRQNSDVEIEILDCISPAPKNSVLSLVWLFVGLADGVNPHLA